MEMSNAEIVASYRQAKDPQKQIGILAQLNGCMPKAITSILEQEGVIELAVITDTSWRKEAVKTEPLKTRKAYKRVDPDRIKELYDAGYTDAQIMEKMNIGKSSVQRWRQACGLSSNKRAAAVIDPDFEKVVQEMAETNETKPQESAEIVPPTKTNEVDVVNEKLIQSCKDVEFAMHDFRSNTDRSEQLRIGVLMERTLDLLQTMWNAIV